MPIEAVLQDLGAALEDLGLPAPRAPVSRDALHELVAEIAPLRLPCDVRRFWELVDPSTLAVVRYPPLCAPQRSLVEWRIHHLPGFPAVLLPIGSESWALIFVELHGPEDTLGGPLFEWSYGASHFIFTSLSLCDLLADVVDALRTGQYERGGGYVHLVPHGAEYASLGDSTPLGPHPVYGDIAEIPVQPEGWPGRWLALPAQ